MVKMKKTWRVVAAVLAVVAIGTLAACKSRHGHSPEKLKKHVEASLKKVGATEEQRLKIGTVTDRIVADGGSLCKNNQGLGKQVTDNLLLDQPNKEWLHRTVDEKAQELAAFAHRTVDSLVEISALLTAEQRMELKTRYESAHGTRKH